MTGLKSQRMDADTLTRIDSTARMDYSTYPDSTAILLTEWAYHKDSILLFSPNSWLKGSDQYFNQKDHYRIARHEGTTRPNKIMSESLLLILLLLEVSLFAYIIKNGIKYIDESIKNVLKSDERGGFSTEAGLKGANYRQYLWVLSLVIFALMIPVLINAHDNQMNYFLDSWLFLRLFLYVSLYFVVINIVYRMLGMIFFNRVQTERWVSGNKAVLSFYALSLTPILIGVEIGFQMKALFIFSWVMGFFLIAKLWILLKSFNIFCIRKEGYFYLILYLCALEILPILLFFKGIFLLLPERPFNI